MFLKSLEIQGFKSFADKVHFSFSPGVTAIVGPNGSGKSNVVDAIRWVLGEQSAKTLRGAKMEDVIFSGSVDRKPVGMARVTMILDNSQRVFAMDCDEIEVSRTLHRSGESQYMLNKSSCRLKDIQELFMDTGLGKDGFSVIGQGKIEEILTLHAEERRGLIEEAAGISKYKYRKHEAERKLEATNDDMTRLDDILYELEKRLGPLSKQAEKVRVYRSLKAESDALQLAHLTKQYLQDKESLGAQETALQESEQDALAAQVRLNQLEADVTEEKLTLEEERHAMEAVQVAYTSALREAQEHERALGILSERRQHIEKRYEDLGQVLESETSSLHALRAQCESAQVAAQDSAQAVQDVSAEVKVAEQALDASEKALVQLKHDIEHLQSEQFSVLSKQASTNNEMTRLEQSLSGDSARKERLEQRLSGLAGQKEALLADLAKEDAAAQALQQADSATHEAVDALRQNLQRAQESVKVVDEKAHQTAHALMQAKSRLETLEEFESSGEGYFQGVQAVLRAKKEERLRGIQGSVLQLLEIPSEYLTAIENALGSASQNVVVESDSDAQAAIGWLKKERRGRVTFMPLNLVRGKRQDIAFDDDAVVGLALDLVQFNQKYEPIMAQLLGRVWVLRDLESATRLSKRTGSKYRFVTLDGDVIAPGGTMTGGHLKKQSSIVYRKHEMGVLRERIEALNTALKGLESEQEQWRTQIAVMKEKLEGLQGDLQERQLKLREVAVVKNQLQEQLKRLQREMDLEILNQQELHAANEDARQTLQGLQAAAEDIAVQLATIEADAQEKRLYLKDYEEARDTAQRDVQAVLVRKATVDEQYQAQQKEVQGLQTRLQVMTTQYDAKKAEIESIQIEKAQLDEELTTTKAAWQQAMEIYQTQSVQIQVAKDRIDQMDVAVREQEKQIVEARKAYDKLWRIYQTADLQLERLKERVPQLEAQFLELFGYSGDEAVAQADLEMDTTHAVDRLKTLRKKMEMLGEINFTALEEYEQVSEQSTFLRGQIEDLNQAKEKLEAVIHEMEVTMASRFKEAYEKVNEQFSQIFTAMFGGGSARLELSMPGRYLETGVEIIAQPPGKKERVLTLLSGGERALTAAALLFALLEVRPSPFVILDEIEAALDEANVERFASFIVQYTNKTQFIIISHRKGTMEAASVLYGITMDANGVSKQVSVRLSDFSEA